MDTRDGVSRLSIENASRDFHFAWLRESEKGEEDEE